MANIKIKQCKQCGSDYEWQHGKMGSLRGTCSVKCNKARVRERNLHLARSGYFKDRYTPKKDVQGYCPVCSTPFVGNAKKKYCSVRCGGEARARKSGAIPVSERNALRKNAALKTCPQCQTKFLPSRGDAHSNGPQVCCSVDCSLFRKKGQSRKPHKYPQANFCTECGCAVATNRRCCVNCAPEKARFKARQKAAESKGKTPYACAECGEVFEAEYGDKRRKFCSQSCSLKNSRRTAKRKRRAAKRSSQAESVDLIAICIRDDWHCYLCGIPTPRNLRGTSEPNAPEVDHVIPLSKGGHHKEGNLRCSCRKCNSLKSDHIELLGVPVLAERIGSYLGKKMGRGAVSSFQL